MDVRMLRAVGVATAAYGVAVTLRPEWLARPSGLVESDGSVSDAVVTSLRPVGWRDAASGVALAVAPEGPAMVTAAAVRLAADFGDAVVLARTLPPSRRLPAVVISVGWGALTVAGLLRRRSFQRLA
jgi:hypothetical protein